MALERILFPITEKCSKLVEWKVKPGSLISKGRILLHYVDVKTGDKPSEVQKLKASKVGTVNSLLIQEGVNIMPGDALLEMESCSHPTVMRDLCAECGADLSNEKQTASVPMVHSVPDLKVSIEQAQKLGKVDEERLLSHRKLVLLVDLDQTLIHTTNDDIPPNLKDVHHFQLYGSTSPWYHTRLRPLTKKFLEDVSQLYELHICTFGARSYAHTIAKILDPDEKLFSHRILSRDECFDSNSKTANLKALFPCGDHMVCIIDDREDVWNFAPNLIAVKPYHFFQHTGDIHAPPGLDKHEQDGSGYTQSGNESNPTQSVEAEKPKDSKAEATEEPSTVKEDKEDAVEEKSEVKENPVAETEEAPADSAEKVDTSEQCTDPQPVDAKPAGNPESGKEETEKVEEAESKEETMIDIPDADDYLLYLQDILQRIHEEYYSLYDETKVAPNMREVVPAVKRRVLAQQSIVFSGVVPTHVQLANSRSAQMAKSLGATVAEQIVPGETTHLVAARPGTAKVNEARRAGTGIHIVSPEWLVCTSERWERAEERLFPLTRSAKRIIPESNSRLSTSSMAESLNPLLALSSEDLKSMDQEVEDIFNETDDESAMDRDADSEEDDEEEEGERKEKIKFDNSEICAELLTELKSESCLEVEDAEEVPPSKKRSISEVEEGDSTSEGPNTKLFRDYNETPTSDADEDLGDSGDESELCEMGLALEREFLAD